MRKSVSSEAAAFLQKVIATLLAQPFDATTADGATFRWTCGDLSANAETAIRSFAIGAPLKACFDAAYDAGVDADGFGRVRTMIEAAAPAYQLTEVVAVLALRLALSAECKAMADLTVTSRSQVDILISRMKAAFEPAIDYAADHHQSDAMQTLGALYGAVIRDLTERGRKLPEIVHYSTVCSRPALALANRLYGDAERADELVAENSAPNPLFMPVSGRALSR
jgi:hypothetical protein